MSDNTNIVLYSLDDSIARITLNRPEKRNALNDQLIAGINAALVRADEDERARVVVLSGAGKDFCSGADLTALEKIAASSISDNVVDAQSLVELFTLIRRLRLPVIAAVKGRALAGGCGLATACDLILASKNSRFGYPEVRIGFVPAIVLSILRRNVSEKKAFELITRGEEISADEAQEIGLINRVFDDETFEESLTVYLAGFQNCSKSAVSLTKRLLYQVDGLGFSEAVSIGADVNVIARMTSDCREGISKFLKRQ
jgi:methylglutaconyl-CoA hydratase